MHRKDFAAIRDKREAQGERSDMALIENLKLEMVERDPAKGTATLRVGYRTRLTSLESSLEDLQFREQIQLQEIFASEPTEVLYELAGDTFASTREGVVVREHLFTVEDRILGGGSSELGEDIKARVSVTPYLPEICVEDGCRAASC